MSNTLWKTKINSNWRDRSKPKDWCSVCGNQRGKHRGINGQCPAVYPTSEKQWNDVGGYFDPGYRKYNKIIGRVFTNKKTGVEYTAQKAWRVVPAAYVSQNAITKGAPVFLLTSKIYPGFKVEPEEVVSYYKLRKYYD